MLDTRRSIFLMLTIQAALVICGFGIRDFDYPRTAKWAKTQRIMRENSSVVSKGLKYIN